MQAPLADFIRENISKDTKQIKEIHPFVFKEIQLGDGEIIKDGVKLTYYPDGVTLHIWVYGINGLKHGFEKKYWPSGSLKHKIEWDMGTKIGRETTWHENGNIRSTIDWKDGKETETLYTFYDNGEKRSEVPFRDGLMHGTQRHYYCCGQIYAEIQFFHGKRHGYEKSWYTNGKKKTQLSYHHDLPDGLEILWNEDGSYHEQSTWNKGKLIQAIYFDKGKPIGAEIHKGNKVHIVEHMTPVKKTKTKQSSLVAALEAKKKSISTHSK